MHRPILALSLALSTACCSKDTPSAGVGQGSTSGDVTSAGGSGGSFAGAGGAVSTCQGLGGTPAPGSSRLGFKPAVRSDDGDAVKALGGLPYAAGDSFYQEKNALLRAELQIGPAPGVARLFGIERRDHGIGPKDWPNAYDDWSVSKGRQMVLSLLPSDSKGAAASLCEVAETSNIDAEIKAAALRVQTFVNDHVKTRIYLVWAHEPEQARYTARVTTVNEISTSNLPVTVVVESRAGVGLGCAIPGGKSLTLTDANGGNAKTVILAKPAAAGDMTISVTGTPGKVPKGHGGVSQDAAAQRLSYVASYLKVKKTFEDTWGNWPNKKKVRWTWIVSHASFEAGVADKLYPGDGEVDVIGADIVNSYGVSVQETWTDLSDHAGAVQKFDAAHGHKDVMLGEVGSLEGVAVAITADVAPSPTPVVVPCAPLSGGFGAAGDDVLIFSKDGAVVGKATLISAVAVGGSSFQIDKIDIGLHPGTIAVIRPAGRSKAQWIDRARGYIESCWPEVVGVAWVNGGEAGMWLDEAPQGSYAAVKAFKVWGADPYFAP